MTTLKYISAGLFSYLVYLGLVIILIERVSLSTIPAVMISYGIAMLMNYVINFNLVFKRQDGHLWSAVCYILVGLAGYTANTVGFYLFVDIYGIHYSVAQPVLFLGIGGVTYLVNKNWTFATARY